MLMYFDAVIYGLEISVTQEIVCKWLYIDVYILHRYVVQENIIKLNNFSPY